MVTLQVDTGNDVGEKRILGKGNNVSKLSSASITSIYLSQVDFLL